MNKYNTNINELTCDCLDYQYIRSVYSKDNPRRLCKHLINKIDIEKLSKELNYFKEDILFYKENEKGFNRQGYLTLIPNIDIKILYDNHWTDEWINIYTPDGNTYGILADNVRKYIVWARNKKPNNYEKIEFFFESKFTEIPLDIQEEEKIILINKIKEVIPNYRNKILSISDENYIPDKFGVYYGLFDENYDLNGITVQNNCFIIKIYGDRNYTIDRDFNFAKECQLRKEIRQEEENRIRSEIWKKLDEERQEEIEKKRLLVEEKGYLYKIKDLQYNELIKDKNSEEIEDIYYNKYCVLKEKISKKYLNTQELIKKYNIQYNTAQFHRLLRKMNYIKKEKNLNLNDWIIYDKGLDYGLNLAKETYYFNNKIPDWYKVMEWDILNIELILNESNSGVRMTRILWCSDKIQSLLEKIKEFEELDKTNKLNTVNDKIQERNEWLKYVSCPHCNSKNIHKKDKRKRKKFEIQRYQCVDCKRIFQKKIGSKFSGDIENEDIETAFIDNKSFLAKIKLFFKGK